jgi:hypothetical protein
MRCTPCFLRRSTALAAVLTIALGAPGCMPAGEADAIGAEESIINGTRETGYPEVVAVYWQMGSTAGGLCTGTVIGPYAILTAKHCVFSENPDGSHTLVPAANFYVIETDDINSGDIMPGDVNQVFEVRTTPGSNIDSDVSNGRDIAILILRDAIDVAPRGVATGGPSIGENVTAVGFGRTSTTDTMSAGVKYRGAMRVSMVGTYQILAGAAPSGGGWTCQGDSGGPLIDAAGNVTGITSYGFDRSCRVDDSVFVRVTAFRSLIDSALAFVPPCTPSGETCNGLDDDCDGTPDDGIGCIEPGNACTESRECSRGTCEDVGGAMLCTRSCFPDSPMGCPTGLYCEVTGCGSGRCIPGAVGGAPDGTACTADTDCASGHCPTLRAGRYCGTACCPMFDVHCADPTAVCDLIPGAMGAGACVPAELAMGPRPFGSPCTVCDPAASSFCPIGYHCSAGACVVGDLAPPGGRCASASDCRDGLECVEGACASACDPAATDACPLGTSCEPEAGMNVCVPPGVSLGEACMTNADCRSMICATVCTTLCDTVACPSGFECVPVGEYMACLPPGAGRPVSGGCAASPAGARAPLGVALVLAALALAKSRARRR